MKVFFFGALDISELIVQQDIFLNEVSKVVSNCEKQHRMCTRFFQVTLLGVLSDLFRS